MTNKFLLLDMDGTVRESASGQQFIHPPLDQKIISGADSAIARYDALGWTILGATNQGGVAANKKTIMDCIDEQMYTLKLLPLIHKIYFCPDYEGKQLGVCSRFGGYQELHPWGYSSFRKPAPGMIEYCLDTHEVSECLFVGDREEDQSAALAAGVPFMWAHVWRDRASLERD